MSSLLPENKAALEAEHGPIIAISHPDGTCFAFKRLNRNSFDLYQKRIGRGDETQAMDMLMQSQCVWPPPGPIEWGKYVDTHGLEPLAYQKAYRDNHGGLKCRLLDSDEIEIKELLPELTHITNKEVTFAFHKPGRAQVKTFQHMVLSSDPKAIETLVRSCAADTTFDAWLDVNLFAAREFGDELIAACGMDQTRALK